MSNKILPGRPYPLGATWDGAGVNFSLYSEHAEWVELCLFNDPNGPETERLRLPERTTYVWHGYIRGLLPGQLYGYRVHGPFQPNEGLRFNAHKLVVDPYAKVLAGQVAAAISKALEKPCASGGREKSFPAGRHDPVS